MEEGLNLDGAAWGVMDNNTVTNVTVQLGATAFLHCHVRTFGDRTVGGAEVSIYLEYNIHNKLNR